MAKTRRKGRQTASAGGRKGQGASRKAARSEASGGSLAVRRTGGEFQPFGVLVPRPLALPARTCSRSVRNLNALLADTLALRDLYKKHHWQVTGPTFREMHKLFDAHYEAQAELVDVIAERIAMLGGVSVAMPHDVAEETRIPRPPRGREPLPIQLRRLLEAHEIILGEARTFAAEADADGDDGTNDMIVGNVIRTHEMQVWFLSEHLG